MVWRDHEAPAWPGGGSVHAFSLPPRARGPAARGRTAPIAAPDLRAEAGPKFGGFGKAMARWLQGTTIRCLCLAKMCQKTKGVSIWRQDVINSIQLIEKDLCESSKTREKEGRRLSKMYMKQKGLVEIEETLSKIYVIEKNTLLNSTTETARKKRGEFLGCKATKLLKTYIEKMSENCFVKMFMKAQLLARRLPRC